ncbi:MAG: FHA domain-containing protein [Pyrinomonadaceae bacterium]|nr:FHA domain-containing protein [Pyrinomonadaceae bacterium]MCX7639514.1 FHA domain-containing protein [Pyrinomonadaceae bacterium]MDW8304435.1 adenylate/guanylate cyclase domain-containing protein [Acidobacteriota bacterium]
MKGVLRITDASGTRSEVTLPETGVLRIGRAEDNDIIIKDRRVSRHHAHITASKDGYKIIDGYFVNGELIRSANHVFVNGIQVYEKDLQDGDIITIGSCRIEFSVEKSISLKSEERDISPIDFEEQPMGETQFFISAKEIIERQSGAPEELSKSEEIKSLRRKAEILSMFYEMSKLLSASFDLREIFAKATELIFKATPAERVVALLVEEDKAEEINLSPIAIKLRNEQTSNLAEKLKVSKTITRKVLQEKVAILSQDIRSDAQFSTAESIYLQGVRSTICAPLITEKSVHGVIYADRMTPYEVFTKDDLELVTTVAVQTAIVVETVRAHKRLAQEEIARSNYSRFMPEYVVNQILSNPDSFRLGGVNQKITVLFADIRGFTSISENENPERIVELLNRYFSVMSEIIFSHGGTLDKYIGDGLMAIFGAPNVSLEDATNAVKCAIAMQKRLTELNEELKKDGFQQIGIGIGLHTGVATVGYIGSERRSEYTAIGDTVNLASRLEELAQINEILISEATAKDCLESFRLVKRHPLKVKNRLQPVNLFEVKWN